MVGKTVHINDRRQRRIQDFLEGGALLILKDIIRGDCDTQCIVNSILGEIIGRMQLSVQSILACEACKTGGGGGGSGGMPPIQENFWNLFLLKLNLRGFYYFTF